MGWITSPVGKRPPLADYNDTATVTTPINLGLTNVKLTNDGLGSFTNTGFWPVALQPLWNTGTGQFDLDELALGDQVDIRVDLSVTTGGTDRTLALDLALGIGNTPYTLNIDTVYPFKASTFQLVRWFSFYIGDENTRTGKGELQMRSDSATGDSVVVNGWYYRVHRNA